MGVLGSGRAGVAVRLLVAVGAGRQLGLVLLGDGLLLSAGGSEVGLRGLIIQLLVR